MLYQGTLLGHSVGILCDGLLNKPTMAYLANVLYAMATLQFRLLF